MPGRLQIGRDQPQGLGGGFDLGHRIPLPLDAQIRHALALLDVPDFPRADLLAADGVME